MKKKLTLTWNFSNLDSLQYRFFLFREEKYGFPQGGQQFFRGLNWGIF